MCKKKEVLPHVEHTYGSQEEHDPNFTNIGHTEIFDDNEPKEDFNTDSLSAWKGEK